MVMAAIASTIGTARGNTQASWRPRAFKVVSGLFFPGLGGIEVNGNEHGPFHHFRFFADFKHIGNLTELLAGGRLVILQSEVRGLMTITTA